MEDPFFFQGLRADDDVQLLIINDVMNMNLNVLDFGFGSMFRRFGILDSEALSDVLRFWIRKHVLTQIEIDQCSLGEWFYSVFIRADDVHVVPESQLV